MKYKLEMKGKKFLRVLIYSKIFEGVCHVYDDRSGGQCSAVLNNPYNYTLLKMAYISIAWTVSLLNPEKADITWTQGVVRLQYFSFGNITSFDVHEDMSRSF